MTKYNPSQAVTQTISKEIQRRQKSQVSMVDMAWLVGDKEEVFCLLVADGIPLAIAFKRAGFDTKDRCKSALTLYRSERIQARIKAIIHARATQPPVSLSEVTDMMKRVYTGAIHDTEYNAAHNAAFSLARLHGLVVDRAQLDVIRRPSREPDAPSEQALSTWIESLPTHASVNPKLVSPIPNPSPVVIEATALGSDLDGGTGGTIGNGAPSRGVTGTPSSGGNSDPEEIPPMDELF